MQSFEMYFFFLSIVLPIKHGCNDSSLCLYTPFAMEASGDGVYFPSLKRRLALRIILTNRMWQQWHWAISELKH